MAYQIALPALIANLPILSEFRFVPGSGRGIKFPACKPLNVD